MPLHSHDLLVLPRRPYPPGLDERSELCEALEWAQELSGKETAEHPAGGCQ